MKRIFFNIILIIFIILTTLNVIFFTEIIKNKDLRGFYFQNKELPSNYSEKETLHMQEVKNLTNVSLIINLVLLISVFILKTKTNFKKMGISLIAISILLFIIAISFERFFYYFHLTFFTTNNWLLPANSVLIQTYPLEFFRNRFLLFISITLTIGIFLVYKRNILSYIKHKNSK